MSIGSYDMWEPDREGSRMSEGEVAELVRIIRKVAKNSGVRLHDVFVGRLAEAIVASRER